MHRENFLHDAQSWAHLGEGAGDQPKPPLFVAHGPEDFPVPFKSPPVVDMLAERNLFLSIYFRQSRTNPLRIHAEVRLGFQPVEDRLG